MWLPICGCTMPVQRWPRRQWPTALPKVDGKTEMIVHDLEGRILGRLYLPLASIRPQRGCLRYDLFTVGHGK